MEKHEWTLTGNYFNALGLAESDGFGTDGACTNAPVHPDEADAGPSAVGDDRIGNLWSCGQECGLHWRSHLLHMGETGTAQNIWSMRIYGNDVIAA